MSAVPSGPHPLIGAPATTHTDAAHRVSAESWNETLGVEVVAICGANWGRIAYRASMADIWDDLRWFVVFNGIADANLWGFDADGWRLRHGDPAAGMLGILPEAEGGARATLDDALWLADALAFDHDAPVESIRRCRANFPTSNRRILRRCRRSIR